MQPALYSVDYFFVSNSVIPRGCQSRAVALALYMTQSEIKKQLFPKEPIVSDYNLLNILTMTKGYMILMDLLRVYDEQE